MVAIVQTVALRVIFADDNYLVREGVSALLAEAEGIDVVATATDLGSLITSVAENSPDVVLTDIRMPPTNTNEGIQAAKRIRSEHSSVGVVVLSQYVEEDYAFELLADGVAGMGYLLKERVTDLDELVRALREVARGGSVLDPLVVEALLARRVGVGLEYGPTAAGGIAITTSSRTSCRRICRIAHQAGPAVDDPAPGRLRYRRQHRLGVHRDPTPRHRRAPRLDLHASRLRRSLAYFIVRRPAA
jgi:CheY-like chemotaxis protein